MRTSITRAVNEPWSAACGYPVNTLLDGVLVHEKPTGALPFIIGGVPYRALTLEYDLEELKREHFLD